MRAWVVVGFLVVGCGGSRSDDHGPLAITGTVRIQGTATVVPEATIEIVGTSPLVATKADGNGNYSLTLPSTGPTFFRTTAKKSRGHLRAIEVVRMLTNYDLMVDSDAINGDWTTQVPTFDPALGIVDLTAPATIDTPSAIPVGTAFVNVPIGPRTIHPTSACNALGFSLDAVPAEANLTTYVTLDCD